MPRKVFFASLFTIPAVLSAQIDPVARAARTPCTGTVRELTALTPRRVLAEMQVAGSPAHDLIADGAACTTAAMDASAFLAQYRSGFLHLSVLSPVARFSALGGISDPRDDGPVWSGRGATAFARIGVTLDFGPLHAIAAPDVWTAQNSPYDVFPSPDSGRSTFASPWYGPPRSIDLPSRFGATSFNQVDVGETAAWLSLFSIDVGASTSSQRWGPSVQNNIFLGADAPGIPRAFVRTSRPIRTRIGSFDGTFFVGTLTKSRFFDNDPSNGNRTLKAIAGTWSPSDSSMMAIGFTHGRMRNGAWFGSASESNPQTGPTLELNTVFGRIGDPFAGVRAYVELGRFGRLPSMRDFLTIPYQGIGYVVGAERAIAMRNGVFLITAEAQNLEQPTDKYGDSTVDFYTSALVKQGWTQRGQLLGSGAGPGGESQWLAFDYITPGWSAGLFGERVRWNEDVLIRDFLAHPNRHDVTIRGGARLSFVRFRQELALELSTGKRLNYLFQNGDFIPGYRTVDIAIPELRFTFTPAVPIRK